VSRWPTKQVRARGDYSILSGMEIRNDELFAAFGASIDDLVLCHRKDLEKHAKPVRS